MSRNRFAFLFVLTIFCGIIGLTTWLVMRDPLLYVCESELADRLKSPAGYKRVSYTISEEQLSEEKLRIYGSQKKWGDPEWLIARGKPYIRRIRNIVYDAPNSFGVLIRGYAECSYVSRKDDHTISDFLVEIDGKTKTEWLIYQLRNQ